MYIIKENLCENTFSLISESGHTETTMHKNFIPLLLDISKGDFKLLIKESSYLKLPQKTLELIKENYDFLPPSMPDETIMTPISQYIYLHSSNTAFEAILKLLTTVFNFSTDGCFEVARQASEKGKALVFAGSKGQVSVMMEKLNYQKAYLTKFEPSLLSENIHLEIA